MRVAVVRVNPYLLEHIFAARPQVVISSDWPADAKVINAQWDFHKREILMMVTSSEFDDVLDGQIPPEWSPTFTARDIPGSLMEMFERMGEEGRSGITGA